MPTSYGFLSPYPPTQSGLATFALGLRDALSTRDQVHVVQATDAQVFTPRPEVVAELRAGRPDSVLPTVAALNRRDIVIVQHEYDAYGGPDGAELLTVLDLLTVPVIVVLHTVLAFPTPHQRTVLERVMAAADTVVVMTETARHRLQVGYQVDVDTIVVVPHGAPVRDPDRPAGGSDRPTILTWGLLGPGKGIEWALIGLREIRQMLPPPRYVIAGPTHPKVRQQRGEAYRLGLLTRARGLGVQHLVRFERGYLDPVPLRRLIEAADVVLLPYDSHEQVTSGVLVEAVAAHKPVVSTAFPHAVELLSSGAGLLVPHGDGAAIGTALRKVLTDPALAERMSAEAAVVAEGLHWPVVAERYRALADDLLRAPAVTAR